MFNVCSFCLLFIHFILLQNQITFDLLTAKIQIQINVFSYLIFHLVLVLTIRPIYRRCFSLYISNAIYFAPFFQFLVCHTFGIWLNLSFYFFFFLAIYPKALTTIQVKNISNNKNINTMGKKTTKMIMLLIVGFTLNDMTFLTQ